MPTYKNLKELRADLEKKIEASLASNVAKQVEKTVKEHIQTDVYNSYSPVIYERRNELKDAPFYHDVYNVAGIITLQSYSTASSNVSLVYGSSYDGQAGDFAQMINDGKVPNIFNNLRYIWQTPRPFYDNAILELKNGGLVKAALQRGLAQRGIKTK